MLTSAASCKVALAAVEPEAPSIDDPRVEKGIALIAAKAVGGQGGLEQVVELLVAPRAGEVREIDEIIGLVGVGDDWAVSGTAWITWNRLWRTTNSAGAIGEPLEAVLHRVELGHIW